MSRSFSHLTPRYLRDRAAFAIDQRLHPDRPWLTADAIRLLDELLQPTDIGVEFGSGRSTIWFARRLAHLTSIEGDPAWHKKVKGMIHAIGIGEKISYHLETDDKAYAERALTFDDDSLDFALVDGGPRDQCAKMILPKIKSGGLLAIDNVNWFFPNAKTRSPSSRRVPGDYESDAWADVAKMIADWRSIWTSNGVTDTGIWFKP